jgi:hypothetical protein
MAWLRGAVLGAILLTAMSSCTTKASTMDSSGPTYTCCAEADVNKLYHPGDTISIHWIVVPSTTAPGGHAPQVELRASLAGSFGTVGDLKQANGGGTVRGDTTYEATPIRPSGQSGEQPVSLIAIPANAAPGYYNLTTSVTRPDFTVSGGAVIQITPKTAQARWRAVNGAHLVALVRAGATFKSGRLVERGQRGARAGAVAA